MPKLKALNDNGELVGYRFYCPGCDEMHWVETRNNGWKFNGDMDKPTFSPSILVRSGHYTDGHSGDCWCTYNEKHPNDPSSFQCKQCHSFVTNGKIQYLSDCTHKLAGQTIELLDLDTVWR